MAGDFVQAGRASSGASPLPQLVAFQCGRGLAPDGHKYLHNAVATKVTTMRSEPLLIVILI
ncbi:hypothetical protein VC36_13795 [Pseudomonas marginalis]|nr:hypothetical protein VC37_21975 [Pseudomonas marginalis]KJZ59459.1 hypothetical protein VC36_13795 [Pseudomonas marginalis]